MLSIPLQPVPAQRLNTLLASQTVTLDIRHTAHGMFCSVAVDDVPVVTNVVARNLNMLVRDRYQPFAGDLVFFDTQGSDDPVWTQLGSRFLLLYLSTSELVA